MLNGGGSAGAASHVPPARRASDRWRRAVLLWLAWLPAVPGRPPPERPARGSNCMNAAFMSPELHERGIHAVSRGAGGPVPR